MFSLREEWKKIVAIVSIFLILFFMPMDSGRFTNAVMESFHLVKWYAREHVLLCLIPAFFISGAVSVFISKSAVMKYLGVKANKILAYGVASVSGVVLAVCSCTVLPLFVGIYRMGAGIGPACAFLYAGPAINVLSIVLTARILGFELGIARAIGAVAFSVLIGLFMHLIFRKEEMKKEGVEMVMPDDGKSKSLWQTALYFASMIGILVFATWGKPVGESIGLWSSIYELKWILVSFFTVALSIILVLWFNMKWWRMLFTAIPVIILSFVFPDKPMIVFATGAVGLSIFTVRNKGETEEWFTSSWEFAKQILPLLLLGVAIAGLLLGRVGHEGLIPSKWISDVVGGNSFFSIAFASVAATFMYFATLTEVPVLEGLLANGMGQGPALALLLAGPALSLPSMLVINSVLGVKKTFAFILLVIIMAIISGLIYGNLMPAKTTKIQSSKLPVFLDFGMESCVQCKNMKKVMADLNEKCSKELEVKYVNILKEPEKGEDYGVSQIPMQIFYDKKGKELYRHVGFISAKEILNKFSEFGIEISKEEDFLEIENKLLENKKTKAIKKEKEFDLYEMKIPENYTGFVFYMFHSEDRCPCNDTITSLVETTLEENFLQVLQKNQAIYQDVNIESETNEHFVDEYGLGPYYHLHNGVVLVKMTNGKRKEWKLLEEADSLKENDEEFIEYAKKEIKEFIK